MESMTGYAFLEKNTEQFSFSIELKSLNSKYLECFINLPRILRNEENEIDGILKKRFGRGKLELNIEVYDWVSTKPVNLNRDLLRKYYRELQALSRELKTQREVSLERLLVLEGVVMREKSTLSARSRTDLYQSLNKVIDTAIKMRKKEGAGTGKDIQASLGAIKANAAKIKALSNGVSKALYLKLKSKIEALAASGVDEHRLYTEVAILADKQDINEELVRLGEHLVRFRQIMVSGGQMGKQLDFLCQEIFREVNTIASKSNSSEISHLVVDTKTQIDKIREQCRNVV